VSSSPAPLIEPKRERLRLIIFSSERSGRCRKVDGFLSGVLQRGHNHETFEIVRVSADERPDLVARFRVEQLPTLFVVEGKKVRRRIEAPRRARALADELAPWLRGPAAARRRSA